MTDYSYFSSDYFQDGKKCGTVYSNYKDSVRTSPIYKGIAETLVKIFRPKRALEIGCATGIIVRYLNDMGVDAHGIDVSEWAVKNAEHPNVILTGAEKLPYDDEQFDLVYSIHSLEHIPKALADQAFKEIARVCKFHQIHMLPLVGTPPYDGPEAQVLLGLKKDPTHNLLHNREWWISKLSEPGMVANDFRILWPTDTENFELATCQIVLSRAHVADDLPRAIGEHNIEMARLLHEKAKRLDEQVMASAKRALLAHLNTTRDFFDCASPRLTLKGSWGDLAVKFDEPVDFSNRTFTLLISTEANKNDEPQMRLAILSGNDSEPNVLEKWFSLKPGFSILEFDPRDLALLSGSPNLAKANKIYFGGKVKNASFRIILAVDGNIIGNWAIN